MTDQSEPTADGLVAAVLAVMPMWDGEIITGTKTERTEYAPDEPRNVCARSGEPLIPDEYEVPVFGDPKAAAAEIAANVLRCAADELDPGNLNIEGIVRWMRARANEIHPTIRLDMLDFPTAWEIQRRGVEHKPRCSSVPGWSPISGPALLCDCGAVETEWRRLVSADEIDPPKEADHAES